MGRAIPYVVFPPFYISSLSRSFLTLVSMYHTRPTSCGGRIAHSRFAPLTPFQAGVSLPIRVPTRHWGGLFALPTVSVSCPTASFFASTILSHLVHPSQVFFRPLLFPTRGLEP